MALVPSVARYSYYIVSATSHRKIKCLINAELQTKEH